jgi:hypothetical protein
MSLSASMLKLTTRFPHAARGAILLDVAHAHLYSFSMSATTIKLEGKLLAQLQQIKPRTQSVSAFVRTLIEDAVRRSTLAEAARQYQQFLASTPTEREWLDEWTAADLLSPPKDALS